MATGLEQFRGLRPTQQDEVVNAALETIRRHYRKYVVNEVGEELVKLLEERGKDLVWCDYDPRTDTLEFSLVVFMDGLLHGVTYTYGLTLDNLLDALGEVEPLGERLFQVVFETALSTVLHKCLYIKKEFWQPVWESLERLLQRRLYTEAITVNEDNPRIVSSVTPEFCKDALLRVLSQEVEGPVDNVMNHLLSMESLGACILDNLTKRPWFQDLPVDTHLESVDKGELLDGEDE